MKVPKQKDNNSKSAKSSGLFFKNSEAEIVSSEVQNTSFFNPKNIQAKLEIGEPGDSYEKQADRVADKVVSQNEKSLQRAPILQLKNKVKSANVVSDKIGKSNGQPLPKSTNQFMSSSIGADFSGVRVHTNTEAVQLSTSLNAKAFTHGNDIYFNTGQYNPESRAGKHLLAHELVHTVQQGNLVNNKIQREVFEDHEVTGNASGYADTVISDLRIASNAAQGHLNSYGLEIRNAISAFSSYASSRLSSIGDDFEGAGFVNSLISIALSAVPVPGAGALLRVVGSAIRDAIVSEIRSKLTSAAQQVTSGRDTNTLSNAVSEISIRTTDIATGLRDRAYQEFIALIDPIIIALNNNDQLSSQQNEIVGMFYRAPMANTNDYLNRYFGIPMGDSLVDVQIGVYRNLIRAFEAEVFRETGTLRQNIYWTTRAQGRDSGVDTYAKNAANRESTRRRRELESQNNQ